MKICNTCLYHVEKLSNYKYFFIGFFYLTKVGAALDAVCFRCLSLYFVVLNAHAGRALLREAAQL